MHEIKLKRVRPLAEAIFAGRVHAGTGRRVLIDSVDVKMDRTLDP